MQIPWAKKQICPNFSFELCFNYYREVNLELLPDGLSEKFSPRHLIKFCSLMHFIHKVNRS